MEAMHIECFLSPLQRLSALWYTHNPWSDSTIHRRQTGVLLLRRRLLHFFSISTANRTYFSNYLNSIFYNGKYRVQVAYDIASEFNILSKLPKATPFIAIFKHHLLGWGSWTRTSEYRSQSPVPYRLGDTPILVGTWGFEPETVRL